MPAGDDHEEYEPTWEEIEALLEAEREFRAEHDLLGDEVWDAYCLERARDWLADQPDDPRLAPPEERARALMLNDIHQRIEAEKKAKSDPLGESVSVEERWPYELTPIEAQFYDVLAETGLTFSVQPWMQHADRKYRADFLIYYDGRVVCVELDGHEYHKTKEQRGKDAARDRWLLSRGIRVVRFTGSEVYADADGCVRELLDVIRESQARP
jgi:very-short-patch-repair endonuclease